MIPGIGGRLLSHAYLEQQLLPELRESHAHSRDGEFQRRLGQWWRRVARSLGPASSARQVFDVATSPLLDALGYAAPNMWPHGDLLAGTSAGVGLGPVLVLTLPWSAPIDLRGATACAVA